MAKFRMSLKAHKNPWKMRPIVCCAGTMLNMLSRWLDYWLQQTKPFIATYIKDSGQLLDLLQNLGPLPPNARLFTADANSMYTNIDTDHALKVISEWLESIIDQLPPNFPLPAVIDAMAIVMRNNLFEWGDKHFLQLLGTAMGTSSAVMWANTYYWTHEKSKLIPAYHHCLLLFRRFVDDMFGVWIGSDEEWISFKNDVSNFGILTWEFEERCSSLAFLDLTINIEGNRITTKTYQKALNLYQYIPPTSEHPKSMMKGIIHGLLRNYHRQNTKVNDYYNMATKLYERHVARGWDKSTMRHYILTADAKIQHNHKHPNTTPTTIPTTEPTEEPNNKERLFLHWDYHRDDIPRNKLRDLYNLHCEHEFANTLGIKQTTICYSRPKNIKDLLTKAKLHQAPGREASKFYSGELL